mmetsp:Transcript_24308/g.61338  ORF Transcript_24308/g.61338 Transcript_24308/m.61338 type:complete len:216 (-) Transcript_24308:303-950(-)
MSEEGHLPDSHQVESRPDGLGGGFSDLSAHDPAQKDIARCEQLKQSVMKSDPIVRTLLSAAIERGLSEKDRMMTCAVCVGPGRCPDALFSPGNGVVICVNSTAMNDEEEMKASLRHELVHAFDYAGGELDMKDAASLACSEVRAAHLSKQCEGVRGFFSNPMIGMPEWVTDGCIRKSAVLSMENDHQSVAEEEVDKVFDRCKLDMRPLVNPSKHE